MPFKPQDHLEPFQVSKKKFADLLESPRLAQRALFHGLVVVTIQGGRGRETKIDYQSAKAFYQEYIMGGKKVPLLPSEEKRGNPPAQKPPRRKPKK